MKILCTGDLHIKATAPHNRIDDYYQTQLSKLKWIFDLAEKENCEAILQPGDFCDSPDLPNHVVKDIISLAYHCESYLLSVFGQHDKKYRNNDNTVLSVLEEAEAVYPLKDTPFRFSNNVEIYGASWEEEVPKVQDTKAINILVLHKMIIANEPLWPGQTDYVKADTFLKTYKNYDLIISGDNHQSFIRLASNKGNCPILINCGSLMRMTTTQQNHRPCVWIYNSETKKAKRYFIPIQPSEEVFSPEAEETKERNLEMEAFIEKLATGDKEVTLSFEDNLNVLMDKKVESQVKELANGFLERYYQ